MLTACRACFPKRSCGTRSEDTVSVYESGFAQPWTMQELPSNYLDGMVRGIVGIEIALTRLEGKFKLSQNRSPEDRESVIAHLRQSGHALDNEIADRMRQVSASEEITIKGNLDHDDNDAVPFP